MLYQPSDDTNLILSNIKKFAKGSVLDMGTGTGALAREAHLHCSNVTAVDINPKAITYAKENSPKTIKFVESDLFTNVKDQFELIIFNPPYLPEDKREDVGSALATTGGKQGFEIIERFLEDANNYLTPDGQILLLFSSLTNKDKVDELITKNLYGFKMVETKMLSMFEQLYLYSLQKTKLLQQLKEVSDLKFFAKGHRGYIYTGKYQKKAVTVKLKNPKSKASGRIKNEIETLKVLNKHKIGPNLIKSTNDYFIYDFVEGEFMPMYIRDERDKTKIRKHLIDLLNQMYTLDKLKINKEEMHHPHKHILIKNKAVLLDFEKANKSTKPHNVTQFCQYLCSLKPVLKQKGIFVNITKIRELSRVYKKKYDEKAFNEIVKSIS